MDISKKINKKTEDLELIIKELENGGCLKTHSLGTWLCDSNSNILYNLSDIVILNLRNRIDVNCCYR